MKPGILFLCLSLVCLSPSRAEPTTPEQRRRIVEITRALEEKPFGDSAPTDRAWAANLLHQASDIRLRINADLLRELLSSKIPDREAVFGQFVLGFASFVLEHAERASEEPALYEAAFISALRVYQKAVERNVANRMDFFEKVSEKERSGTLKHHIEQLLSER